MVLLAQIYFCSHTIEMKDLLSPGSTKMFFFKNQNKVDEERLFPVISELWFDEKEITSLVTLAISCEWNDAFGGFSL